MFSVGDKVLVEQDLGDGGEIWAIAGTITLVGGGYIIVEVLIDVERELVLNEDGSWNDFGHRLTAYPE